MNLEKEIAGAGWEQSPTLYALVWTRSVLPQLRLNLSTDQFQALEENLAQNPTHLTPVLQDQLPPRSVSETLGQIIFGEDVQGVALALERFMIPPQVLQGAPSDPVAREEYLLKHPSRQDVRLVIGVDRHQNSWCTTRSRDNDQDELVGQGPDLVPELITALGLTLVSDQELSALSD